MENRSCVNSFIPVDEDPWSFCTCSRWHGPNFRLVLSFPSGRQTINWVFRDWNQLGRHQNQHILSLSDGDLSKSWQNRFEHKVLSLRRRVTNRHKTTKLQRLSKRQTPHRTSVHTSARLAQQYHLKYLLIFLCQIPDPTQPLVSMEHAQSATQSSLMHRCRLEDKLHRRTTRSPTHDMRQQSHLLTK